MCSAMVDLHLMKSDRSHRSLCRLQVITGKLLAECEQLWCVRSGLRVKLGARSNKIYGGRSTLKNLVWNQKEHLSPTRRRFDGII